VGSYSAVQCSAVIAVSCVVCTQEGMHYNVIMRLRSHYNIITLHVVAGDTVVMQAYVIILFILLFINIKTQPTRS
jgi:hypothetical protein